MKTIQGSNVVHLQITREKRTLVRPVFLKLLLVAVALAALTGVWHGN